MNRETWKNMTDGERQCLVAEIAGWSHQGDYWWHDEKDKSRPPEDDGIRAMPPDYLNDLNAMHDAEMSASGGPGLLARWQSNLILTCGSVDAALRATAAQRAEAFALIMSTEEQP